LYQLLSKVTVTSCSLTVFTSNVQCVRLAAGRRTLKICCYRSRLVFIWCLKDTDISPGAFAPNMF